MNDKVRLDIKYNKAIKQYIYQPQLPLLPATENIENLSLLIEGDSLNIICQNDSLKELLYQIVKSCGSVIVHRATPSQKSDMVNLVRERTNDVTLAIGDGANDVNMIKAAHLGIGIFGKEGHQAASNSDYAIGEFQHLWRLIFVHGRWNGLRITYFVYFFFYKNFLLTVCQLYFAINNGFSGQTVFDDNYILLYNTIITAIPIIIYALQNQDMNLKTNWLISNFMYYLFYETNNSDLFNIPTYLIWILFAIGHSALIYYTTLYLSCLTSFETEGKQPGFWLASFTSITAVILLQITVLFADTTYWTWLILLLYILTGILFYIPAFTFIYDALPYCYFAHKLTIFLSSGEFWIMLFFCLIACNIPFYIFKSVLYFLFPSFKKSLIKNMLLLSNTQNERNNVNLNYYNNNFYDFYSESSSRGSRFVNKPYYSNYNLQLFIANKPTYNYI